MHRLRFPPALTDPLLPFKPTHSSALVVWGYLGRAIPCLMSSEAKISVLASEWLASLWALLPERNQWEVLFFFFFFFFGGSVSTLKLKGAAKRKGTKTNISRETVGGKKWTLYLCCHVQTNFLLFWRRWLLGSWIPHFKICFAYFLTKLTLRRGKKVWWQEKRKHKISHACAHSPRMKQSRCRHTVNLFCPSHSWHLALRLDSHSAERHRLGVWLWRGWASRCHRTNELIY